MKFSDNILRDELDIVYVKRSEKDMQSRDESNSLLWDIEEFNIAYDKAIRTKVHLYSTPVRDVRIGENIYDENGEFVAYRSN